MFEAIVIAFFAGCVAGYFMGRSDEKFRASELQFLSEIEEERHERDEVPTLH